MLPVAGVVNSPHVRPMPYFSLLLESRLLHAGFRVRGLRGNQKAPKELQKPLPGSEKAEAPEKTPRKGAQKIARQTPSPSPNIESQSATHPKSLNTSQSCLIKRIRARKRPGNPPETPKLLMAADCEGQRTAARACFL